MRRGLCLWAVLISAPAFAASVPQAVSLGGQLFNSDGTAITQSNVNFKLEVFDAAESCVLYSESHLAIDLSQSQGRFNLLLGAGSGKVNNVGTAGVFDQTVFANAGTTPVANCSQTSVALNPGDSRQIRISYDLGTGTFVAMTPDVPIVSSAYAMIADSVQGKTATDFIQVNTSGSTALSQTNAEYAFSGVNWPRLKALLDGNSSQYFEANPTAPLAMNTQRITGLADPTSAQDAATKNYVDQNFAGKPVDVSAVGPMTGNGAVMQWDATQNKWVAGLVNTSPTGAAGGDLTGTYPSPTIANNAITAAKINSAGGGVNRLLITDATTGATIGYGSCALNQVYAWTATGWACTSVATLAPVTSVAGKTGAVTLNAADITGLGTAALFDAGSAAGQIPKLDGSARMPAVDGSQLLNVNAVALQTRPVSTVVPTAGQVLGWNGSAWMPVVASSGSVTSVNTGAGLLGGPITSTGTISVDVGTTASQIVQLDALARLPGLDGSLLFNVKLGTRTVATTTPAAGQVLGWNQTTSQWEPTTAAMGSVQSVSSGTGLVGGTITSTGTLSVDVGITAGKILQLNGSAQIPAVDGSLLTNVNAVQLQARPVSNVAPSAGQYLAWNQTSSAWMPQTDAGGSLTLVNTGVGLLGGPITTTGTLAVDVGTTANKILQLDGSAQIPAVDGSLVVNVNASKLATRAVSAASPGAGQVLGWNATTSQWEPVLGTAGSVTSVQTANGLLGGPITSTGTLSIDAGTTANKILQLNGVAQIPAVDGSLLFNVNATKLATRAVSAAAPGAGQVLGWNTTTTQWEPVSAATGSVQNVASGIGLLGGPITSTGTLNVDVGTTANKILQLNASAQVPAVDGSLLFAVNATKLATRAVSAASPGVGQVLGWNTTSSQWEPTTAATGSVQNVATGTGLLGGPITSNGTITVDVGTTANKILQLNSSAQIPAVDGSLLSNVNASKLATRIVSSAIPGVGQVLGWNQTTTQWEPTSAATGSVQTVASGVGLLGGPITSTGTLNVDVGTAANKILQLNAAAQIPAVDGSLLANVNAVKLQTRAVSAAPPAAGQVLGWNQATSQWEPSAGNANAVTNIQTANGLLGGPITATGTLAVDTGTTANKILQLNGAAQIPGVDGSLLQNVNAVQIATRAISGATPAAGQVLGWNGTTSQWEPTASAAGTQWTTNGNGVYYAGGNVSVGNANNASYMFNVAGTTMIGDPSATTYDATPALSVVGPINSTAQPVNMNVYDTTAMATGVGGGIGLMGNDGSTDRTFALVHGGKENSTSGNYAGFFSIWTRPNGGAITERVRVDSSGNVGIGTSAPTAALHVQSGTQSTSTSTGAVVVSGGLGLGGNIFSGGNIQSTGSITSVFGTVAGSTLTAGSGAGVAAFLTDSSKAMTFSPDGTERVRVAVGGNVGIGTNNPLAALDVNVTGANSALIVPRDSSANRPGTPVNGMVRYNTSLAAMEGYVNGAWSTFATGSGVGSVQSVTGGAGLIGGVITSTGTLSVDVGTAANKIVQLNASAQLPAVDGSLLSNVNASKLATRTVSSATPGVGQVLGWNQTTTQWEPTTPSTGPWLVNGSNTYYNAGSVGIGTSTPGQKLTVSAGSVALDSGYALTLDGPTDLNWRIGRNIGGFTKQMLYASSLDFVASGNGGEGFALGASGTTYFEAGPAGAYVAGPVGIGTGAPQAVLDVFGTGTGASAMIVPRDTTANRPSAPVNGMLRYNTSTAAMEGYVNGAWSPLSTGAGGVTSLTAGSGLLGGTITTTGTVSVDVGSAASKIVQENASAQIAQGLGTLAAPAYSFAGNTNTGLYSPAVNQLALVTNGTAAVNVSAAGYVGIGSAAPQSLLDAYGAGTSTAGLSVTHTSGSGNAALYVSEYGTGTPFIQMNQARGTMAAPTATQAGDNLGVWQTQGVGGGAPVGGTYLVSTAEIAFTGTSAATALAINTTAPGATSPVERFRVTGAGNVGVGTTTPQQRLEVVGTLRLNSGGSSGYGELDIDGGTQFTGAQIRKETSSQWAFKSVDTADVAYYTDNLPSHGLYVKTGGNVGVGMTTPAYRLDVSGDVNIASSNALRFGGTSVCTSSGCTSSSDRTLKENISPLKDSLDKILALQGVEYDYKDKAKFTDHHQIGVIAQDIEKTFPEVVTKDPRTGLRAVAYDHLVAPLIEAVKTIHRRLTGVERDVAAVRTEVKQGLDERDEKIKALERENAAMKERVDRLERALNHK